MVRAWRLVCDQAISQRPDDFGVVEDLHYIVTEYIEGVSLREAVNSARHKGEFTSFAKGGQNRSSAEDTRFRPEVDAVSNISRGEVKRS